MSMFPKREPFVAKKEPIAPPIASLAEAAEEIAQYAPKRPAAPQSDDASHEVMAKGLEVYNKLRADFATAKVSLEAAQSQITQRDNKIEVLKLQIIQLQTDIATYKADRDAAIESETSWRAFFANLRTIVDNQDKQLMTFFSGLKALFDQYQLPAAPPKGKRGKITKTDEPTKEAEPEPVVVDPTATAQEAITEALRTAPPK